LAPDHEQEQWRPSADMAVLRLRAILLYRIRQFFYERHVLEVDTPILSHAGNPDVHIESFRTFYDGPGGSHNLYLQTSPEFAMKRLLASGSGPVYQICKAFRDEELSRIHNPEFTMLEWYRPGFDHHQLMDEVQAFLVHLDLLAPDESVQKFTYQQLFQHFADIDPHTATREECAACVRLHAIQMGAGRSVPSEASIEYSKDMLLDVILTHIIEPELRKLSFIFVYDYPQNQASLAKIRHGNPSVAERFELFGKGLELANGFNELTDNEEQLQRFTQDQAVRKERGQQDINIDQYLIDSIRNGLPECAGVAIGFDRLLMLACGKQSLEEVLCFPFGRA